MGFQSAAEAIDGLMGAIYHRFAFLDMTVDQLGVATGTASRVFKMGRSDVAAMCAAPTSTARFETPVDCLGQPLKRSSYEALCRRLPDAAAYRPPHPVSCPDGTRLDAEFMRRVCNSPPPAARFASAGRYYQPCSDGLRIDADWLHAACAGRVSGARYQGSGSYFRICEPPRRVDAGWFESFCANLPPGARYSDSLKFQRPCAEPHEIRVEYLEELRRARLAQAPAVVTWPTDGADDVPPAFFNEEPDPLPDLAVSGYPVSVEFNPHYADDVELLSLRLYAVDPDGGERELTGRLLDRESDPNGLFNARQFAWFPLQRLDWATQHRVEFVARVDGIERLITWNFKTRGSEARLLQASAADSRFAVVSGTEYWLYLPPTDEQPLTVMSARTEYRRGNQVTLALVDPNTLSVLVDAPACDRILLTFEDGRRVTLIPDSCPG
jgi:hypothetical protein